MRRRSSAAETVRVQTSLPAKVFRALEREAGVRGLSVSQVAAEALQRGLKGRVQADPEDRLLTLERRLSDHMRLTARDLQIVEELQFAIARVLFTRLPETAHDRDPVLQAAVDARLKKLLDEVASKINAGPPPSRAVPEIAGSPSAEVPAA